MSDSAIELARRLPSNFQQFADEIGEGQAGIYGAAAGELLRATLDVRLSRALRNPRIAMLSAGARRHWAGLACVALEGEVGRVLMIHALRGHDLDGVGETLLRAGVSHLCARGAKTVLFECIPFFPLRGERVFQPPASARIDQEIMAASTDNGEAGRSPAHTGVACGPATLEIAAQVLVQAYENHPWRALREETQNPATALAFLRRVARGAYGAHRDGYTRVALSGGEVVGVIAGGRLSADVGLVLHVAVRPDVQGQGIGGALLRELKGQFRPTGFVPSPWPWFRTARPARCMTNTVSGACAPFQAT